MPERVQPLVNTETIPNDAQMLVNALGELMRRPPWFARPPLDATSAHRLADPRRRASEAVEEPPTRRDHPPSRRCLIDVPLDAVRNVKNRVGCTVNDVVLALCAGALRRLIDRSGVVGALPRSSPGCRSPFARRPRKGRWATGCRSCWCHLTDIADPLDRLHAIHAHTSAAEERHDPLRPGR